MLRIAEQYAGQSYPEAFTLTEAIAYPTESVLFWSILFLFSGIIWLLLSRDRYVIYLDTISGTHKVLSDPNGLFVAQVARAISEAIGCRE